jgi:hypothetical protein
MRKLHAPHWQGQGQGFTQYNVKYRLHGLGVVSAMETMSDRSLVTVGDVVLVGGDGGGDGAVLLLMLLTCTHRHP